MLKVLAIAAAIVGMVAVSWMYPSACPLRPGSDRANSLAVPAGDLQRGQTAASEATPHPSDASPVVVLNDSNFVDTVLGSDKPMLVDFYADWCGPCRTMAPIVEDIAASAGDQYLVGKLDVDANPRAAAHFEVDSLPTMFIFKDGEVVDRVIGVTEADELKARVLEHV